MLFALIGVACVNHLAVFGVGCKAFFVPFPAFGKFLLMFFLKLWICRAICFYFSLVSGGYDAPLLACNGVIGVSFACGGV